MKKPRDMTRSTRQWPARAPDPAVKGKPRAPERQTVWSPLEAGPSRHQGASAKESVEKSVEKSVARGEPGLQPDAATVRPGRVPGAKDKDAWKLKSPRRKFRSGRAERGASGASPDEHPHLLYGIHSVKEALHNPRRRFHRLHATENGAMRLAEDGPLPIQPLIVKPDEIGRRLEADAVHQGVLLETEPLEPIALGDIPGDALVLALDQVTDPHNVGAILRSCAAFGVSALLITERHSPEVTGVLAKAASGALEHVPFASVRNLSAALETLKARGFLCLGLDSAAPEPIGRIEMRRPLVLVLGAEGKGLRQKTIATCSRLVRLDMPGTIRSLNVSNAAAIALYAVTTSLESERMIPS